MLSNQNRALADGFAAGSLDHDTIITTCMETTEWLADYFAENGAANDPVMQGLRDASADAFDLMQLIELETGDTVTRDALNLMVQLRDEVAARLAA